jgi:hypothetical protein
LDCDEALIFDAAVRWLEHSPERKDNDAICTSLLKLIRFPLMDSCLLSDVIKVHHIMRGSERVDLLLEAFEYHALRYDNATQ